MRTKLVLRRRGASAKKRRAAAGSVICFATRKRVERGPAYVNPCVEDFLRRVLAEVLRGEVTGLVAVTVGPSKTYTVFIDKGPDGELVSLIGRVEVLAHDLKNKT